MTVIKIPFQIFFLSCHRFQDWFAVAQAVTFRYLKRLVTCDNKRQFRRDLLNTAAAQTGLYKLIDLFGDERQTISFLRLFFYNANVQKICSNKLFLIVKVFWVWHFSRIIFVKVLFVI